MVRWPLSSRCGVSARVPPTRTPTHRSWLRLRDPRAQRCGGVRQSGGFEAQIEKESHAFAVTARLYDDGIIDPRDTRTVLGMSLSAVHSQTVAGRRGFGVFRM